VKRKIIFVDDDNNILDGLKRMLHDQVEAWEMSFISHPVRALEMMQAENFDAAIIDVNMPGMTGIEMLSEIKNHPHTREMEVIILTGQMEHETKRQALSLGASDLLIKPVLRDDLLARLRSALRNKVLKDELAAQRDELEKQLIYAQRMELVSSLAEHAARSLSEVMSAIVWYGKLAEQLLDTIVEGNADIALAKENLRAIQQSGAHAKQLMDYVLSLSQQTQDPWQRIDLAQLVSDTINVAKVLAPRGFSFQYPIPEDALIVKGDPAQLFQLLLELVIFAIQHTRSGNGLELQLARVKAHDPGVEPVKVSASLKISATAQLKVEQPIRSASNKLPSDMTFTAQGLHSQVIAQRIANLHGGSLVVSESPGTGVSILFSLPLADTKIDADPTRASEA
jgi:DNA-binding response OmpR family regulator